MSILPWWLNKAAQPAVHPHMNPTESVTETRTFLVPEENLQELQAKFGRITKRAKRLSLTPPNIAVDHNPEIRQYEWSEATERWNELKDGKAPTRGAKIKIRKYYSVVLTGQAPVLPGGWELAAVLTRVEGGNLIASTGKHEVPKRYRDTESQCEHCQLNRKRLETFLVTNEAGDWKQIGRNCIGDFLGADAMDPDRIVAMAEMLAAAIEAGEMGEEEGTSGGGGRENEWGLDEVIAYSVAVIRKLGFVSSKQAEERGGMRTASIVLRHMRPSPWDLTDMKKDGIGHIIPTDDDYVTAETIIDWAKATKGDSDFDHNMRLLAQHRFVDRRTLGIAVYLAAGYARSLETERKAREPRIVSQFVGTVGDRMTLTLTVASSRVMPPSDWGTSTLVMFRDEAGNSLKWFGSGDFSNWKEGDVVTVKATIKGHEEYKGSKQTMLTRVQEFDAAEEAAKKAASKAASKEKAAIAKAMKTAGVVIEDDKASVNGEVFATKGPWDWMLSKAAFAARVKSLYAIRQRGITVTTKDAYTHVAKKDGETIATSGSYQLVDDFISTLPRENPGAGASPLLPWW